MISSERRALRVNRFGEPPDQPASERLRAKAGLVLVRVTHASVGVTDVMAMRGDYLLQPLPRFVPGYDFVGVIEHLPESHDRDLAVGQRVAGVLPHMGAHASVVAVAPTLLVHVPDVLDSAVAASLPLDAVTARFALDMLPTGSRNVLINGAGGAVGAWAVQIAATMGLRVFGTASERSQARTEALGAEVYDYRDTDWIDALVLNSGGGADGAIDHTGNHVLRHAVAPHGRIIRIAFEGRPGHQRLATASGFAYRYAQPSERFCSTPMLLRGKESRYRQALSEVLGAVADQRMLAPSPQLFPASDYAHALSAAGTPTPGSKVVLLMQ